MLPPPKPDNDSERINALLALALLDTQIEERFDRLTRIAQRYFGVPISLLTLIDEDRQWFKSNQGLNVNSTSRDISFCGHTILQDEVFVIEDSLKDGRFFDNPLVTGYPHIRFYAGAPVHASGGHRIGAMCIISDQPRAFSSEDASMLRDLADCIEQELSQVNLIRTTSEVAQYALEAKYHDVWQNSLDAHTLRFGPDWKLQDCNPAMLVLVGAQSLEQLQSLTFEQLHPERQPDGELSMDKVKRVFKQVLGSGSVREETRLKRLDGTVVDCDFVLHRLVVGDKVCVQSTFRDITSRKLAEAALQEQQAENRKLAEMVARADNAIVLTDAAGRIEWVTEGFTRMTGFVLNEVLGRKPGSFLQGPLTDRQTVAHMAQHIQNR